MTSSNSHLLIQEKMKFLVQLARKCVIDNIEDEIAKAESEDIRSAYVDKLTEILESELVFNKPKTYVITVKHQGVPSEPVNVRGTSLKLKNMTNNVVYRKFCTSIANVLGYASDFSDAPFGNLPRNTRVYEAIKKLYSSGRLDQESLDQLVQEAEE